MELCVSVNWFKIGWLIVVLNLLFVPELSHAQNLPPVIELGVPNQHAEVGLPFSYTIPSNAFKDENNDQLTYNVGTLPAWLSFDSNTRILNGIPTGTGTFSVTVSANDGAYSGGTTFAITVHPSGATYAAFTSNTQIGCNFRQVNFQNRSKGATAYFWDLGNGNTSTNPNPSAIYNSPGNYTVTLTINGGGSAALTHTETITIHSLPSPQINKNIATGCEPLTTTLNYNGSSGGGTPAYYYWYFFEKSPGQYTFSPNVSVNELPGGDYNVILRVTDENGCSGSTVFNKLFHVYEKPEAYYSIEKSDACSPSLTTFTDGSILNDGEISDYYWNVNGNSLSINNELAEYDFSSNGPGSYEVTLQTRSEHGCLSETFRDTVVFNSLNTANFNVNPLYCSNDTATFQATTSIGAINYRWDFNNDGSIDGTGSDFSKILTEPGTFPLKLSVMFNDGCYIETTKNIRVDRVDAAFNHSSQYNCTSNNFAVNFNSTSSTFLGDPIAQHQWYLVTAASQTLISSQTSFQRTFNQPGTYTIRLDVVSNNGCVDSETREIQLQYPQTTISVNGQTSGCIDGQSISFSADFSSQFESAISYNWSFGDGNSASGQNVSHVYSNPGNFSVSVTVGTSSGCTYTGRRNNVVQLANKPIITNVELLQTANKCFANGIQLEVDYSAGVDLLTFNTPTGTSPVVDPGVSPYTFNYSFSNTGTYNFEVIASQYGCASDPFTIINVDAFEPKASFSPSQSTFCDNPPYDATFANTSTFSDPATEFYWDFGDGSSSTEQSPTHQYTETGDFIVTLTVTNPNTGCSDQHAEVLNIYSFDNATGIISANVIEGCAPLSVNFTQNIASRLSPNYQIDELHWDFNNDGTIDSITSSTDPVSFTYNNPGLYSVRLVTKSSSGCDYQFVEPALIKASGPIVNFTHSPSMVCLNTNVQFTGSVTKPSFDTANPANNTYQWDFGDGSNDNVLNPQHTYTTDTTHTVSLTVTDQNGCVTTRLKPDLINIIPFEVDFSLSETIICNNSSVEIQNASTGNISRFLWDFDGDSNVDLITTNTNAVSHVFVNPGHYNITLTAEVADGCSKTISQAVTVVNADASFSAASQNIGCAPAFAYFEPVANADEVISYSWSFGDGNFSSERSPRNFYTDPGKYTVSLTVRFRGGCSKTVTRNNYITAAGAYGEFNFDKTLGCAPNPVLFSVSKMSSVNYIDWDFGDGIVERDTVPSSVNYYETTYAYQQLGYRYPQVILTDEVCGEYTYNKVDSIYTSVPPVPAFVSNYDSVCRGVPIQFTDLSTSPDPLYGINNWKWYFGTTANDSSIVKNPVYAYRNMGVFSPSLIVTNQLGCSDTLTKNSGIRIYGNTDLSADFEIGPSNRDTLACAWQNVNFYSKANAGSNTIVDYKWDFGSIRKSGINSQFAFADSLKGNNVTVTHIVIDDKLCIDSTSRTVAINNLQAAFGYEPQSVFRGSTVDFTDQSVPHSGQSISNWSWNFGNGLPVSSPVSNPQNIAYNNIINNNAVRLVVTDNRNCTDTSLVLFDVLNNPPVIDTLTITLVMNSNYIFRRSDFESRFDAADPGQSMVSIRIETGAYNGSFRFNGSAYTIGTAIPVDQINKLEFVPISNWYGNTEFTWSAFDGFGWSDFPETVFVVVLEIPDPPKPVDIVIDLPEDETARVGRQLFIDHMGSVLVNSFEFDSLVVLSNVSPSIGTLNFNGNPLSGPFPFLILGDQIDDDYALFEYYPENGYNGAISFQWNAHDGYNFAVSPARVIINYFNTPPQLTNIEISGLKEDQQVIFTKADFLNHYSDPDQYDSPKTLYLSNLPPSTEGVFMLGSQTLTRDFSISFNLLSEISFKPASGFEGTTQATWQMSDGDDVGSALIILHYVNTPPVVHDFDVNGFEDEAYFFAINDFDKSPANKIPFDDIDYYDRLQRVRILSLPQYGELRYNGVLVTEGMEINRNDIQLLNYITNLDWFGTDSFEYTAFDGTDWATNNAVVFLQMEAVNDAPRTQPDYYTILEDQELSGVNVGVNDIDVDNDHSSLRYHVATIDSATAGQNGTIYLTAAGDLTFIPNLDFNGTVYFIYTNCDPLNACSKDTVFITVIPMNDPPVAVADTFELYENELHTYFNTLLNDDDVDGDGFYMKEVNGSQVRNIQTPYGAISWNSDGSIEFVMPNAIDTLSAGESIKLTFDYQIEDDSSSTANSYFVLVIKGLNNPPVAVNDLFEAREGFGTIGSSMSQYQTILFNDYDVEGNPITVHSVNNASENIVESYYGTFSWLPNGSWTFTENQAYTDSLKQGEIADVVFPYHISDGFDTSVDEAFITIRIIGVNDTPVAVNDTLIIYEDAGTVIVSTYDASALLVNDFDIDGDGITVWNINKNYSGNVKSPVGALQWNADGSYVYTPDRDSVIQLASGDTIYDIFNYTIADDYNGTASANLVIIILGLNDAPFAMDDSITVFEDTHVTIVAEEEGLLANDGDIDRDPIIVSVNDNDTFTSFGRYGTLTWQPNGAFSYETYIEIVDSLYQGQEVIDVFSYTIVDPYGLTDRANLYVTIVGENDAPVANNHYVSMLEKDPPLTVNNRREGILWNDFDIDDGDQFGIFSINNIESSPVSGTYGQLQWNYDGTFIYTLNPETDTLNFMEVVVDSFIYVIQDRFDSTAFAWFFIEITGQNDAPIAVSDTLSITEDDIEFAPEWTLLDNDYDVDGDEFSMNALNGNPSSPVSTKFARFNWLPDGSFVYNRYVYGNKRIELDTLAWNDVVYDSISYNIVDDKGVQASAYLYLEIIGVNDPPFARTDVNFINENQSSISSVASNHILYNDYDVDRGDSIMLVNIEGDTTGIVIGTYGRLEWKENGHYTFINNPEATDTLAQSERAIDVFRYTIADLLGASTTDSLVITVIGANDRPMAINDTVFIYEDERFIEIHPDNNGLLWNDYDVDRDSIFIMLPGNVEEYSFIGKYGVLTVRATGEASYTLNDEMDTLKFNQTVADVFEYTLFDTQGSSNKAKVMVNIIGENDIPVVPDVFVQIDEDVDSIFATFNDEYALLYNAFDKDGDELSVINVNDSITDFVSGYYGDLYWQANGEYDFINNMERTQPLAEGDTVYERFVFVVADPFEGFDTATFIIEILGLNDAPVAKPDFYNTIEYRPVALTSSMPDHILFNDFDIDGDEITITLVNNENSDMVAGNYGNIIWQSDGTFDYYPDSTIAVALRPGEVIVETFEYTIEDIYQAIDTSTINITIEGINNPPSVKNDTIRVFSRKQLDVPHPNGLLYNASDPDRDTLLVIRVEDDYSGLFEHPNYGNVVWTPEGKVTYETDSLFFVELGSNQQIMRQYEYAIVDEGEEKAYAYLIVHFHGQNDPPQAFDVFTTIKEDSFAIQKINVFDPDYQQKGNIDYGTLSITAGPQNGKAYVNTATGEIYYFPNKNYFGKDSLLYNICDEGSECDQAWFFIDVEPVNDPPRATHLVISTPLNTTVSFNAFYQVDDVDDGVDPASGILNEQPNFGVAEWNTGDSLITYTPFTDSTGVDEFIYSLADFEGERAYVIVNVIVPDDRFGTQNDTVITQENVPVVINVMANDTLNGFEPSPNTLNIKVFPVNGTAGYNPFTRLITYQPDEYFHGVDSLIYIVGSKTGNWDFATLYIRVEPINRPLVANDDAVTTFINQTVEIRILQNDYDYDDGIDTSSVNINIQPLNSKSDIVFDYKTGYARYTPTDDFRGYDQFSYIVCDLNPLEPSCDTATVYILVRSRQEDFSALNDHYSILEGETTQLIPHPIDNDSSSAVLESFTVITPPQHAKAWEINEQTKVITYSPQDNYFGPDWINYRVCDSNNNCDFAQINLWVQPVNDPPVANDDSYVVNENVQKRFYILANDYDVDGTLDWATLDTIAGEGPRKGELIIDHNTGTMLYTPWINSDVDVFRYRIYDNEGAYDEATVMVIVDLGNTILYYQEVTEDVPDTFSVKPPMAAYNLFFDIADSLEMAAPEKGFWDMIFDLADQRIVYNPMPDSTGNDYYNVVLFAANGDSVDLRVYVEIIPVNDPPVALPDTIVWNEPENFTIIHYNQLLYNDYDVDGDPLFLTETIVNHSDSFTFEFNTDSTFTIFSDSIDWCEAWFYYEITDPDGETDTAYVWITPVLTGLVANNDQFDADENSSNNTFDVLDNDSLKDNQRCTIDSMFIAVPPMNGIADVSEDMMVLYRPNDQYYGPDSLMYLIIDIWGQTDSAWVIINVIQLNNPPVAESFSVPNTFSGDIIISILDKAWDTDPEPYGYILFDSTQVTIGKEPLYGTVVFNPDSGWFVYTPFEFTCETDSFGYTVFDNEYGSASAIITIVPKLPEIIAVVDTVRTWPGVPKDFNVLENDLGYFMPYVETFTQPNIGSVEQTGDSTFRYYSDPAFFDKDSMTYELVSPCGNLAIGKVVFIIEELRVPEIITPNDDGKNDVLIIDGIEYFPESMLKVFNRYGHVVYVRRGYRNDWDGHSNQGSFGGDKPLPSGTYYYTLTYNEGRNNQNGIIYIFR